MRIFIVGGGLVGQTIASQLGPEGHDITLMDTDPGLIRSLENHIDGLLVVGNGTNPVDLRNAGIEQADVLVAVTSRDEVNLVCALWANKLSKTVKIARVRQKAYAHEDLPIGLKDIDRIINPDELTVNSIMRLVESPSANEAFDFADGAIYFRGFVVPHDAPIVGKTLNHISRVCAMDHFLVVAILRGKSVIIPRGDEQIKAGDNIFVLLPKEAMPIFLPLINRQIGDVTRVIVSGATPIGVDLAKRLEPMIDQVVMIDSDADRCEKAAEILTKTQVMCGKTTEIQFLKECKIDSADLFVAVSDDDEKNLITSLLARQFVQGRIMMLTSSPDLAPILSLVGPDVAINPRLLTIGHILENIRQGRVLSVFKLKENCAEALEVVVHEKSPLAGKALKDIHFPDGAIIGAVWDEDRMVIPNGKTVIQGGQRVIVFSTEEAVESLERLWR